MNPKSNKKIDQTKSMLVFEVDPTECPFREFRDNEINAELWGLGPAACRAAMLLAKSAAKPPADQVWIDDQIQPLPRSVRKYLHSWIRAEDLAANRWDAEPVIFEENDGSKMKSIDIQLSHTQVLMRSSFCRRVLSACFTLERADVLMVEHQWENFTFSIGSEGWRAKYHIYSPGMKPGGGQQHRPGPSRNGKSDLFALLKLAAPDMNSDEDVDSYEDELMPEFDIIHALTGCMTMVYNVGDKEYLWNLLSKEVPVFGWEDDDETLPSTVKSKNTKKPTIKDSPVPRTKSITTILIEDSRNFPPHYLQGITPAHTMDLFVAMARDLPLKKPLPEPEVALWKHYRWVDWARAHGLYEAYDCPRTKFLKVNGLLKLSHAPHLLDVQSTESITHCFREEQANSNTAKKGKAKDNLNKCAENAVNTQKNKEELRDWVLFDQVHKIAKKVTVVYYPSMFQFTSAASNPPIRITKAATNRSLDIPAPKSAPLYLQIDGPDENVLRISLSMLHPRVMFNCGSPILDQIEPAYFLLERFEWFIDSDLPVLKGYVQTTGYDTVEINFEPGRHFCRLWIHSRMNFHVALLSESELLLGTRDLIQCAAVRECPWASRFLSKLGTAFTNWTRDQRTTSTTSVINSDREFYRSYQPDLNWDKNIVGHDKSLLHWMFRQALQSLLLKKLQPNQLNVVCSVLRRYFCDPDFCMSPKPLLSISLKKIVDSDPCDCVMSEIRENEDIEELSEGQITYKKTSIDQITMYKLLTPPKLPVISQVCELASEDVPCGLLKEEMRKVVRRHEAATLLQAHWRGTWARKCLRSPAVFTAEASKLIQENVFGNLESLSALMNEFFAMYPGAKYAYSVASALTGVYGLHQHHGTTRVFPKCKWIPYFQGVFYCHSPVKVHFDIQSSLQHSTVDVYNNDTEIQIPQAYNFHITFDFTPNSFGYTVMGHGTLNQASGTNMEVHWQLTILSSIDGVFHVCDNDMDFCKPIPLPAASKLHFDEIFLPNRRNILGGVQISVTKQEVVGFRAAVTSPELEIEAVLRTTTNGSIQELGRCTGKGELYWPYIKLYHSQHDSTSNKTRSMSQSNLGTSSARDSMLTSARSLKLAKPAKITSASTKNKSATKLKYLPPEPKQYTIEVIAPKGWPLSLAQWERVMEVRNSRENKIDFAVRKPVKEKPNSAKEKEKDKGLPTVQQYQPQPGDAYIALECSISMGGGATCKRDDTREQEFVAAVRAWEEKEPGRNLKGAQIRKDFRTEFLQAIPVPASETALVAEEETYDEELGEFEDRIKEQFQEVQQGPTPATEIGLLEMSVESEEETLYLTMPELLKDKLVSLDFVPICTREKNDEESAIMTPDKVEAAKQDRQARIQAALERMRELQLYNEIHVLGRQKRRCHLLEKLFVDSQWSPELTEVLELRDNIISQENLKRTLSASKKKQDVKKK